jgi:crotonobetainyl-CoA:carnitine CoA-transferase CaiB-like acyl-CoA transferase
MSTRLPLDGIKVIDLTRARAGPTAVRQLSDWGAETIWIEEPASPESSSEGTLGARHGSDMLNLHRNKRSLSLNLKSEEGKAIFFRLAEHADVIVENYRPDVKRRLGIDYEAVRAVNPRIVYGSISGFGQDGPYANRPGVDQIAQGMGGLMSVTGLPGQGPVRVGIPIADLCAGNFLAQGILLALLERERSGEGQWVHTSLLEAQIAMLDFQAARWLIDGQRPPQAGNNHPTVIPTGVFQTADGHINIAAGGGNMFRRLCGALGVPELLDDERFHTSVARYEHRDVLNEELEAITRTRSSAEWVEALNEAGVPCGPIYHVDETLTDPQVLHLGIARPVEHPTLGRIEVVGQPINLGRTSQPPEMRRPAPQMPGAHTDEVLAELGYDEAAVAALRDRGVV